jgi:hypothetical protein
MALPSSPNQISMGDINVELGRTRTTANTSLAGGNTPTSTSLFGLATSSVNKVAPHAISEFHGYTHSTNNAYIENTGSSYTCTASIGTVGGPCDWNQTISSQLKSAFEAGSNFSTEDDDDLTIPGFNVSGNSDYGIIAYGVTVNGVGYIRKKKFNLDDDGDVSSISTCSTSGYTC